MRLLPRRFLANVSYVAVVVAAGASRECRNASAMTAPVMVPITFSVTSLNDELRIGNAI